MCEEYFVLSAAWVGGGGFAIEAAEVELVAGLWKSSRATFCSWVWVALEGLNFGTIMGLSVSKRVPGYLL